MKIYTKTGDKGETSLWGGRRVSKAHLRIEAYGCVDELNSNIGLLCAEIKRGSLTESAILQQVQDDLFTIGSMLAADPQSKKNLSELRLNQEAIAKLEKEMDHLDVSLEPLQNFILPAGSAAISMAHICRTVCRRAERRVVSLPDGDHNALIITYLNRLSDFFFILARSLAAREGIEEVIWKPPAKS